MNADRNQVAACPVVVTVNMDIDALDAANAGAGGLFGRYSYGRYGARESVWRLLEAFNDERIAATFFVMPDDAPRHPELVRAIVDGGHEVAVRGCVRAAMGQPADLGSLERDRAIIAGVTGVEPCGWRALNGLVTADTLPELARLGYVYDSSSQDDDTPYLMGDGMGAALVEMPTFDYLTDAAFYAGRHSHARVRKAWFEEANAQYAAGAYVNLTVHTRGEIGSGRAPRVQVVADLAHYLQTLPGVGFYTAADLARAWRSFAAVEPFPVALVPDIPQAA